jgi:hypothetical protein
MIEAKEKAKELVSKYVSINLSQVNDLVDGIRISLAKQCALIHVNEMIKSQTHPSDYDEHSNKVVGSRITELGKYYEEVKQEIEKL